MPSTKAIGVSSASSLRRVCNLCSIGICWPAWGGPSSYAGLPRVGRPPHQHPPQLAGPCLPGTASAAKRLSAQALALLERDATGPAAADRPLFCALTGLGARQHPLPVATFSGGRISSRSLLPKECSPTLGGGNRLGRALDHDVAPHRQPFRAIWIFFGAVSSVTPLCRTLT
jgi:hypothetical protein